MSLRKCGPSRGMPLVEERSLVDEQIRQKVNWFPSTEDLRQQLEGTHLKRQLDASLNPHAAHKRLLQVNAYAIMTYPLREMDYDEVYSKNGHCTDGMTGRFNKHIVIKQIITERLFEIQDMMEVTVEHIRKIYEVMGLANQRLCGAHLAVASHFCRWLDSAPT